MAVCLFLIVAITLPPDSACGYIRATLRQWAEAAADGYTACMVRYRRNFLPGGTFFFTVTLRDRRADTLVRYVDLLRQAVHKVKQTRPFEIDAMVVLPEHLHAVWTLPEGDADYSGRWRAIKSRFVRLLITAGERVSRDANGRPLVWQGRFWEHTIRDELDLQRHVDYLHFNPVKHGLVTHVADWPHSSFHRFVERGLLHPDWAGGADTEIEMAGERP